MNTFYGISFAIYFILITLVLTTFIYGLKRDEYNFWKWVIITLSYFRTLSQSYRRRID